MGDESSLESNIWVAGKYCVFRPAVDHLIECGRGPPLPQRLLTDILFLGYQVHHVQVVGSRHDEWESCKSHREGHRHLLQ